MYLLIFKDGRTKYSRHQHGHPAWEDLVVSGELRLFKIELYERDRYLGFTQRRDGQWHVLEEVDDLTGV